MPTNLVNHNRGEGKAQTETLQHQHADTRGVNGEPKAQQISKRYENRKNRKTRNKTGFNRLKQVFLGFPVFSVFFFFSGFFVFFSFLGFFGFLDFFSFFGLFGFSGFYGFFGHFRFSSLFGSVRSVCQRGGTVLSAQADLQRDEYTFFGKCTHKVQNSSCL